MNKFVAYALSAFILFLGVGYMCSRPKVEPVKKPQLTLEDGKKLADAIAQAEFRKADLEMQLADLDSTLAGGHYIYVLHVRAQKVNVNMKTRSGEADAVDFTIPTSREFWMIVRPGDILNAGVDYKGFTFTQNIEGYDVRIMNKDKFKYQHGQYNDID
jgi:hypothetical protein